MSDTAITINLDASNHNTPINSGKDLIQRDAFDALCQQIKADLERTDTPTESARTVVGGNSKREGEDLYPHGSGLTYFIDGTRGAGKSTFLRYAYEHLNSSAEAGQGTAKFGVEPLLYLDPSRIESSEIVLLHVLKHLKRLAEESFDRRSISEFKQDEFRQLFKEMAGGLHLFVSKPDSLKELDAELFLDYGLDRAADSQRLRKLLHRTIALVCQMQGVRALLLAIDDADTKFANAIEVLECVRKYLDTPQMLVFMTGDMEMYSLLVQAHFQQDFASEDRGLNDERRKQQSRMVDHLEEQYLLKLFPTHRRLQLKTLCTLAAKSKKQQSNPGNGKQSSGESIYQVKIPGSDIELSLKDAVDRIATQGLKLRAEADKTLFREHVLRQPVRSVLQLLSTYYRLCEVGNAKADIAASEALRAIALSNLYRHDVDVESIAEGDLPSLIEAVFNLTLLDGEPDTAIYLRPASRDASLRNASASLAAEVARLCSGDPASAISYMLSTAGSSNIYYLVEKHQGKSGTARTSPADALELQKKVKQYLSVGRKDDATNWARHATAALIGATNSRNHVLRQGIVGVRAYQRGGTKSFDAQLNVAIRNLPSGQAYPAIAFSQSGVKQGSNTHRYLSIFNTLGLIGGLLALTPQTDQKRGRGEVLELLNKARSLPTVSAPNWTDLATASTEDDDGDPPQESVRKPKSSDKQGEIEPDPLGKLTSQIADWLKICESLKLEFQPSAVLLGKIWNRLYFSLDNISAPMRASHSESGLCTNSMELYAWALINACLVEEAEYHVIKETKDSNGKTPDPGSIDRKNPVASGAVVMNKFKANVQRLTPNAVPLSYMIASCPLVLGLIETSDQVKNFCRLLNDQLPSADSATQSQLETWTCSTTVWNAIGETTVQKIASTTKASSNNMPAEADDFIGD